MPGNGSFDINVDGNTVVKGGIKSLIIALIIEYDEETTVTHTVKSDKTIDRKRQKALYESFESFRQAIKTKFFVRERHSLAAELLPSLRFKLKTQMEADLDGQRRGSSFG